MKTRTALFFSLLLLTGCGEEPLLPELQGRWAAPNAAKIRKAILINAYPNAPAADAKDPCSNDYVTFGKPRIMLHSNGKTTPLFVVSEARREGSRIILMGREPTLGGGEGRLDLLLRKDEIRFDDIVDKKGRSVRYQRFEIAAAREVGLTSLGDVLQLVFDLKACRA
jgi:hypothetical protein